MMYEAASERCAAAPAMSLMSRLTCGLHRHRRRDAMTGSELGTERVVRASCECSWIDLSVT